MLYAYFDDSREYLDDGKADIGWSDHAIAGYIGPSALWTDVFVPRWTELLASGPRQVTEFKTSDCRNGTGEFKGWSLEERQQFGRAISEELLSSRYSTLFGVAAVMRLPWSEDRDLREKGETMGLQVCLMDVIQSMLQYMHFTQNDSPIRIFCDKQPDRQGQLQNIWRLVRPEAERAYGVQLNDLEFEHSYEHVPLQAADILAYESRKDLKSRFERPPRKKSGLLEALCAARPHLALYYDAKILKGIKDRQPNVCAPVFYAAEIPWLRGTSREILEDPRLNRREWG